MNTEDPETTLYPNHEMLVSINGAEDLEDIKAIEARRDGQTESLEEFLKAVKRIA